jgi:hypothetical protein
VDIRAANPDYLPERNRRARPPGGRPAAGLAAADPPAAAGGTLTRLASCVRPAARWVNQPRTEAIWPVCPGTEGKLEVVQNLTSDALIERAYEGQDLRDPLHRGGVAGPLSIAPRLARGTADLCLSQNPRIGFRALAVHILSVPIGPGPQIAQHPEHRTIRAQVAADLHLDGRVGVSPVGNADLVDRRGSHARLCPFSGFGPSGHR